LVTDQLGETVESYHILVLSGTLESTTNSTAATSTNLAGPLAILVLTVAAPVGLILWRRRVRKKPAVTPGPDPAATLRRIIEPAEGAERFTVELLAEEAGIPLAVVRSTIDRLVSEGRIRSESGADGEEVLSWSPDTGN
jgi:hypothetical protein